VTSQDFTTRLQLQLREAAEREERRGSFGRAGAAARAALLPRTTAGALVAAAALGLALLIGLWTLTASDPRPAPRPATPVGPRVIASVPVAAATNGSAVVAFGAVWVADSDRGEIVRVDPRNRRVTARIPVGAGAAIAAGSGSLWAVRNENSSDRTQLLRIDPRTRRIVARVRLRTRGGGVLNGLGVIAGPRIWAVGFNGAVGVDPATNRVAGAIGVGGGFPLSDALIRDGELWLTNRSGATIRYDARAGRRLGRVPWNAGQPLVPVGADLVRVGRTLVERVDPATGRAAWRRRLGYEIAQAGVAGGRVLVVGVDGVDPRERLWELDARTGRPVAAPVVLSEFGTARILRVGGEAWLLTNGGRAVVVRP
jgi:hypothetical protein